MLYWNKIKFLNKQKINIKLDILSKSLVTVPAAPAFIENKLNPYYWDAVRDADCNIIDSSLFVLLCKVKGYKLFKYSGYKLIHDLVDYLKRNSLKVLLVNPTEKSSIINREFLRNNTKLEKIDIECYTAPIYPKDSKIEDQILLQMITNLNPDLVLINIAGGKQEILGHWLKNRAMSSITIICTGAAISFFTGEQVKMPNWMDKFYLGWLARIIHNPRVFIPRYIKALRMVALFFNYSNTLTEEKEGYGK